MSARPTSVTRAVQLHWVLVLIGLVATILTVVRRDDLIRAWAEGNPAARKALRSGGIDAVLQGSVDPPAFVPVGIVLFVVLALLMWVLLAFFGNGYEWARICLTLMLVSVAIGTVAGIRTGPPTSFVVISVAGLALELVAAGFMWHPDSTAFMRGRWRPTGSETGVPVS